MDQTRSHLPIPLLDAAWDPSLATDDEDEYCWTELQLASYQGDMQRVTAILASTTEEHDRLALVNAPPTGYYGKTALQAACLRGRASVAAALLAAGADVDAAGGNNSPLTALSIACSVGSDELITLLLDAGAAVNPPHVARYNDRTPLQAAAERGHSGVVSRLLALGADTNAPAATSHGRTALQAAVGGGHRLPLVRLLLAGGADVNAPAARYNGATALQAACVVGDREVVEVLIRHGADVNARGSVFNGGTALHTAVAGGHSELARRLLEVGADPNGVAGRARQTPLQSAFLIGRSDIVELLRSAGASGPVGGGKMLFNGTRMSIGIEHAERGQ